MLYITCMVILGDHGLRPYQKPPQFLQKKTFFNQNPQNLTKTKTQTLGGGGFGYKNGANGGFFGKNWYGLGVFGKKGRVFLAKGCKWGGGVSVTGC